MATPSPKDPANPYQPVTTNDKGEELTQVVIDWYRGNRNALTAAQQSAVITAITSVLNNTFKV